MVMMEN